MQCTDLCSTSGDRLVSCTFEFGFLMVYFRKLSRLKFLDVCRLVVGESLKVRRVVPILGVPDALVPLEVPVSQLTLFPGYWNSSQFILFEV